MPSQFGTKREIKALPGELFEGEIVEAIASGAYSNGVGILVATDRRLLFLFRGIVRASSEDFSYDRITSVEYKGGLALASLIVYVSNQKAEIKNLTKPEAKMIADLTRARMTGGSAKIAAASPTDALLQLKQLLDAGILTQEQYDEKAQPLLAQL